MSLDAAYGRLVWEMVESRDSAGEWRVEAMEYDENGRLTGEHQHVTIFGGDDSEMRAKEYLAWKLG